MKKKNTDRMEIYIDGSYRAKTKIGAYGILIIKDGVKQVITGVAINVTNNIMEMTALLETLKFLKETRLHEYNEIEIFCDSQYVVKGVEEWWTKWEANGFLTSTGEPVKNLELWKELIALSKEVKGRLTWVKGHALNELHNEIDKIVFDLTAKSPQELNLEGF